MGKGIYRARELKEAPMSVLGDQYSGKRLVFAIDIAKGRPFGAVSSGSGELAGIWKWDQPGDTRLLVESLMSLGASSVEVVMESTGTYGDALREALRSRGASIYQVGAKRVKDSQEVYDGVPSRHDAKSAALLVWLHARGLSRRWEALSEEARELRAELRVLELSKKSERVQLNRLEGLLARHWPELLEVTSLERASVLETLKKYGGPRGVRRSPQACRRLLKEVGGNFLQEERIESVVQSAKRTTGVAMLKAEEGLVGYLASEARRSQKQRKAMQRRVERLVEGRSELLCMAECVGKVTSAALVSLVGHPKLFESSRGFVKAMGLNLKEVSSGKRRGQLAISKRGPGRARYWLYMAALRMIQSDGVVQAWYEAKVQRDGGLKSKAITAVMRKLARALWHVGRGARFDSRKLFDVSRLELAA